jgi:cytochrome P450
MTSSAAVARFPGFDPTPGRQAYFDADLGAWQVYRYPEVQRVLSDWTRFSSGRGALDPNDTAATGTDSLNDADPPRHRQLRSLVSKAFTPRMVARLEPWLAALCDELLDAVLDAGAMDVNADYARHVPLRAIGRLVGFPTPDLPQLQAWAYTSANVRSPDAVGAQAAMSGYFGALIAERRRIPQDDLLTAMLLAEVDGARLTDAEVVACCVLLLTAGGNTVRDLIGNTWLCFDRHPDALADLRADPGMLPGTIEEVLRYLPPVPQFPRVAAVDTTLDGQPVAAGDWVMARIPSANRDPVEFDRPDEFDIRRTDGRHLTLGHGIHFCLGAPLARLETGIALTAMLRRLADIQLTGEPLVPSVSPFAYGMERIPVTFRPA